VHRYAKEEYDAAKGALKDPKTKDRTVKLLAVCFSQKGPTWVKKKLKGMTKDLEQATTTEFAKVKFDKARAAAMKFRQPCQPEPVAVGGDDAGREDFKLKDEAMAKLTDQVGWKKPPRRGRFDEPLSSL